MQTERWTKVGANGGGWSAVAPWSGRRGALTGSVSGPPRRVRLLFHDVLYFYTSESRRRSPPHLFPGILIHKSVETKRCIYIQV
jgi:hypothetical protein